MLASRDQPHALLPTWCNRTIGHSFKQWAMSSLNDPWFSQIPVSKDNFSTMKKSLSHQGETQSKSLMECPSLIKHRWVSALPWASSKITYSNLWQIKMPRSKVKMAWTISQSIRTWETLMRNLRSLSLRPGEMTIWIWCHKIIIKPIDMRKEGMSIYRSWTAIESTMEGSPMYFHKSRLCIIEKIHRWKRVGIKASTYRSAIIGTTRVQRISEEEECD